MRGKSKRVLMWVMAVCTGRPNSAKAAYAKMEHASRYSDGTDAFSRIIRVVFDEKSRSCVMNAVSSNLDI